MKYYLVAGEASGDLHGSNLIKAIHRHDREADIRCWGGDKMEAAGAVLVKHYRELAFMGFAEVIANLPTILRNIRYCKQDIDQYKPDVLVLIDYPGFNLRIAEWASQQAIKVAYYISPQVWAWKENRVKKMKKFIDRLLVILPFEKEYYANRWQWPVEYVGHPLVEVVRNFQASPLPLQAGKPIVAVLPGSRKQEIQTMLPIMLSVAPKFPGYQFMVAQAPSQHDDLYLPFIGGYPNVSLVRSATYDLLKSSRAAMVTSGTATLETALFHTPQVVCYKGSAVSYAIAKRLVRIKYISLVNLIADKQVVRELIQHHLNTSNLEEELHRLIEEGNYRSEMLAEYRELERLLQNGPEASEQAARSIVQLATASTTV